MRICIVYGTVNWHMRSTVQYSTVGQYWVFWNETDHSIRWLPITSIKHTRPYIMIMIMIMIQYYYIRYCSILYLINSTVQCSTVQYSTVQYSTVHSIIACIAMNCRSCLFWESSSYALSIAIDANISSIVKRICIPRYIPYNGHIMVIVAVSTITLREYWWYIMTVITVRYIDFDSDMNTDDIPYHTALHWIKKTPCDTSTNISYAHCTACYWWWCQYA